MYIRAAYLHSCTTRPYFVLRPVVAASQTNERALCFDTEDAFTMYLLVLVRTKVPGTWYWYVIRTGVSANISNITFQISTSSSSRRSPWYFSLRPGCHVRRYYDMYLVHMI